MPCCYDHDHCAVLVVSIGSRAVNLRYCTAQCGAVDTTPTLPHSSVIAKYLTRLDLSTAQVSCELDTLEPKHQVYKYNAALSLGRSSVGRVSISSDII